MIILITFAEDRYTEAPLLPIKVYHTPVIRTQLDGEGADGRVARNLEGVPAGAVAVDN